MLLIGSLALAAYNPQVKANDIDIICFETDIPRIEAKYDAKFVKQTAYPRAFRSSDGTQIELFIADNSIALREYLKINNAEGPTIKIASLETLYSIKRSHINFPVSFQKHIASYVWLHNKVGGVDTMPEITKQHFRETEERLGPLKTPSLNKSVEEFFGQTAYLIKAYFVHDHIHEAMAHRERPMYEYMQRDPTSARCERDLWEKFTYIEKVQCVLEEAYVIALERKLIPFTLGGGKRWTAADALRWSMMRVCTTLTGGWFRQFATDNYTFIMQTANMQYDIAFWTAVDAGKVEFREGELDEM